MPAGTTARRPPLVAGLDPVLAAHLSTAMTRYSLWLQHVDRPAPPGFDELLAATIRVAKNGQLRITAGVVGDDVRMRTGALLTVDDAAVLVGCSTRTLRRRVAEGDLPVRRLGRLVRVDPLDLLDFLEAA